MQHHPRRPFFIRDKCTLVSLPYVGCQRWHLLELVRLRVRSRAPIQRCSPMESFRSTFQSYLVITDLVGGSTYEITQSEYGS